MSDGSPLESQQDLELSRRAIELAARGIGLVSPSPLVGCVITDASGEVVGEGTYLYDNVIHAEAIALEKAGKKARGGTAYVSLEPHGHHGRTAPCTDALINAGIVRVVCPIDDPNPLVSGKGFEKLRSAGVEVVTGILAEDAARQNEKFICWHRKARPFVHLKLAMSLDGRIALRPDAPTALSGEESRYRVQELRHEYDAILVGSNTALVDDPQLTDRSGLPRRRPLVRVVLDRRLRLKSSSRLASSAKEIPTICFTCSSDVNAMDSLRASGIEVIRLDSHSFEPSNVLDELRKRAIQSVLVEGGSSVAGAFLDAGVIDKVTFLYAPLLVGGTDAPMALKGLGSRSMDSATRLQNVTVDRLGDDLEVTGYLS